MKEKIAIVMVTVLLVGAGFLGSGMAAQRGGGHGPRGFGGPEAFGEGAENGMGIPSQRMLRRILDLSEEQIEEVKLLKQMLKATLKPLNEERRVLREQLKAAMDTDTPDALLVGQLVIYSRNAGEDSQAVRESFADSFKTILTDEQIAKLEGPHDRRGSKGGRRRGSKGGHRRGPNGPEKEGF